jgi:hypothetical protein
MGVFSERKETISINGKDVTVMDCKGRLGPLNLDVAPGSNRAAEAGKAKSPLVMGCVFAECASRSPYRVPVRSTGA